MTLDRQYMKDKADERQEAREEHVRMMLVEFIDQLSQDFVLGCPKYSDRDEVIDIIEKFVTKRRRWL